MLIFVDSFQMFFSNDLVIAGRDYPKTPRRRQGKLYRAILKQYIYMVVATQIFLEFSSLFGEDFQFDDHIFQMG